ncbi:cytochrome P450 [Hysterangium stoloniferum]|nr:cytochrome P450 [Hysterangium stoloniferum]
MGDDDELYGVHADFRTPSVRGIAILIGVTVVISAWIRYTLRPKRLPLSPGPKPPPLLGNLLNMPRSREYDEYTKWRETYGDIAHMEVLGKHIVIINSVDVANDLLERRSAIYSDTPYMPILHDSNLKGVIFIEADVVHARSPQVIITLSHGARRKRKAAGNASPCFVGEALGDLAEMSDPELLRDVTEVAASIYGTASDTSMSPLMYCILALVLNLDIQRRAHTELDTVLGSPQGSDFRLPSFDDRPHLPYIDALDEYRGYRIPKGGIVIANAWAMLHDETVYSDPLTFRPDRLLANVDKTPETDPATRGVFGFGRRVCPGQEVAYALLWIEIASLLAVFDFAPAQDIEGKDIDIGYAAIPDGNIFL